MSDHFGLIYATCLVLKFRMWKNLWLMQGQDNQCQKWTHMWCEHGKTIGICSTHVDGCCFCIIILFRIYKCTNWNVSIMEKFCYNKWNGYVITLWHQCMGEVNGALAGGVIYVHYCGRHSMCYNTFFELHECLRRPRCSSLHDLHG